jgi:hypothetical protein
VKRHTILFCGALALLAMALLPTLAFSASETECDLPKELAEAGIKCADRPLIYRPVQPHKYECDAVPFAALKTGEYVEVPHVTVNLASSDGEPHYGRFKIVLWVDSGKHKDVELAWPRLHDRFGNILRTLSFQYVLDAENTDKIRDSIKKEADKIVGPNVVKEVLIIEIIVN